MSLLISYKNLAERNKRAADITDQLGKRVQLNQAYEFNVKRSKAGTEAVASEPVRPASGKEYLTVEALTDTVKDLVRPHLVNVDELLTFIGSLSPAEMAQFDSLYPVFQKEIQPLTKLKGLELKTLYDSWKARVAQTGLPARVSALPLAKRSVPPSRMPAIYRPSERFEAPFAEADVLREDVVGDEEVKETPEEFKNRLDKKYGGIELGRLDADYIYALESLIANNPDSEASKVAKEQLDAYTDALIGAQRPSVEEIEARKEARRLKAAQKREEARMKKAEAKAEKVRAKEEKQLLEQAERERQRREQAEMEEKRAILEAEEQYKQDLEGQAQLLTESIMQSLPRLLSDPDSLIAHYAELLDKFKRPYLDILAAKLGYNATGFPVKKVKLSLLDNFIKSIDNPNRLANILTETLKDKFVSDKSGIEQIAGEKGETAKSYKKSIASVKSKKSGKKAAGDIQRSISLGSEVPARKASSQKALSRRPEQSSLGRVAAAPKGALRRVYTDDIEQKGIDVDYAPPPTVSEFKTNLGFLKSDGLKRIAKEMGVPVKGRKEALANAIINRYSLAAAQDKKDIYMRVSQM